MKIFFFIKLTVCILILLCAFSSCETTKDEEILPFNAIIGAGGPLTYKEDFLKANKTYGSYNFNGNRVDDETSPKFRTFIITEKARMNEIFSFYPDIDFEKDMLVMYAYTSVYNRQQIIKSITIDNKNLIIEFKIADAKPGYKDASMPQTRFLVVRMNKLDIDTVEFTLLIP